LATLTRQQQMQFAEATAKHLTPTLVAID